MILNCPLPAALTTLVNPDCPFRFDQIVKIAFMQRQPGASPFATEADMKLLATWTPLLAAVDETKVAASPIFAGFVVPKSEPLVQGGNDNSTFAGLEQYYGEGSVRATGTFQNMTSASLLALDELTQFSLSTATGTSNLTAYLINKDGYIFYSGAQYGIPIFNFRVGGTGSEGLNRPNVNDFSFNLIAGWDRALKVVKPTFDPLTEL